MISEPLDRSFFSFGTNGVNDIVALAALIDEADEFLGRILQISVYHRDNIAGRVKQTGRHGGLMPEVTRETQHFQTAVGHRNLLARRKCTVGAAVVYDQKLPILIPGRGG